MNYDSVRTIHSTALPGISFRVRCMSLRRRGELLREVRALGGKLAFLEAGGRVEDQIEATLLAHEVDEIYLRWGLAGVDHLLIDGQAVTAENLAEAGPETLCREIILAIKSECKLTEDEEKN